MVLNQWQFCYPSLPREWGNLAASIGLFGCHTGGWWCYWHLVGRDQELC